MSSDWHVFGRGYNNRLCTQGAFSKNKPSLIKTMLFRNLQKKRLDSEGWICCLGIKENR